MTSARRYVSPKREAQAHATRTAILEAFVEQLSEPGRDKLSPSEAALRAGVSLRTVHVHFPNWGQRSDLCDKVLCKSSQTVDQVYP